MRQPQPFGKYLLLERISVGGMAEVFKAKSFGIEGFEKIIAIKRILPSMAEDAEFIDMFIDEAKIAGQLSHANVCQIFELGKIVDSHFIAMEYVWGKDVLQIQNRFRKLKEPVPVALAALVASKVCAGLHYAHTKRDARGKPLEIIHRDVSPQNILVSYEGEIKLIDFGIAKATSRSSKTQAGVLKGKFGYMSPEQVRGLPLDRRSDLFALGTVLYETLTGERLFIAENDFSTLEKVKNAEVELPSRLNPHVPRDLEAIIMRCLARDPADRYQSAAEIGEELTAFLMGQEPIFTAKDLGAWMKKGFANELEREKQQLELFKRIGQEGGSGDSLDRSREEHTSELRPGARLPSKSGASSRMPITAEPSFDEEDNATIVEEPFARAAAPAGKRVRASSFDEDNPTEIRGEVAVPASEGATTEEASETTIILDRPAGIVDPDDIDASDGIGALDGADTRPDPAPRQGSQRMASVPPPPPIDASPAPASHRPSQPARVVVGVPDATTGRGAPVRPTMPMMTVPELRRRTGGRDIVWGAGAAVLTMLLVVGAYLLLADKPPASAQSGMAPETTATLAIAASDMAAAEVYVDGKLEGAVSGGEALTLEAMSAGEHNVVVKRLGSKDCLQSVMLPPGGTKFVVCRFEEEEKNARLQLDILTEGATVWVDRQEISQQAAQEPLVLAPGEKHQIRVEREGFESSIFELTLAPGEIEKRTVELVALPDDDEPAGRRGAQDDDEDDRPRRRRPSKPPEPPEPAAPAPSGGRPASLSVLMGGGKKAEASAPGYLIASTKPWARVFIDRKDTGLNTPIAVSARIPLDPGKHLVTFEVGGKKFSYAVQIESGKTTRLNKVLPVE